MGTVLIFILEDRKKLKLYFRVLTGKHDTLLSSYLFSLFQGCISYPCKSGSLCIEGSGDGSYMCECQNGLSGKNCDEFGGKLPIMIK